MPEVKNIVAVCLCCPAKLTLGPATVEEISPAEQLDAYASVLPKHGWAMVADAKGLRVILCPACYAKMVKDVEGSMTPFTVRPPCPKCGCMKVTFKFCTGKNVNCHLLTEIGHLHRKCERCSYEWLQKSKDHPCTKT